MESSPLDFVAQACMDLTENIGNTTIQTEREFLINEHIKKVWSIVPPIDDFKKNLEWVNVSEPIYLAQHCIDKVVVLDFWTYCCINCYHVLPDLAHLEKLYKVENGLVIIGVHCAKFLNEKSSNNILAAVERYGIHHPVVNDSEIVMWNALGIRCWPTLLILGPENKPVFILTGEGHRKELEWYVGALIKHFNSSNSISSAPIPMAPSKHLKAKNSILSYPSKIALNPFYRGRADEPYLAISDTGHHRIILTDCLGIILRIVGDSEPGLKDGELSVARFNSPQGLCWLSSSVLLVCDTNNHAIRAIHLDENSVELLTGIGKQAETGDQGGKCLGQQALSSPWDIILYTTPDMDMSVRPSMALPTPVVDNKENTGNEKDKEKKDERRRVVLIACAGSHQIWALFLDNTIWWKYKTYTEGTCVRIAGTGAEAARNSAYPHTAAFAQPSGLTLKNVGSPEVFIADSESSSIRRLALASGHVSTLCGGDRNPLNLFAYGDVDEIGVEAKLQHPLAVAYSEANKTLYIADTYNNKIKKVDIGPQKVTTISPTMIESTDPAIFNEPSGLSVSQDGKYLYIADTNNHLIKILNIAKNVCQEFRVRVPEVKFVEPENLIIYKSDLFVNRKCGNLIIHFNVSLDNDIRKVKFTAGAKQNWRVCIINEDNKDVTMEEFEFIGCTNVGSTLPGRVEMKLKSRTDNTHYRLYLSFVTSLCDGSLCFTHSFTIRSMVLVRDSVKMVESYRITCKVNPTGVNNSLS
ncbi:NHL repeat-containing protein 2 [Pieris rapae]|uniref:NHL repeat-containing protein 2 n=1 Tax=Pieris rapae TaxID=64459 RepID=UPI001E27BB7E|nr:NHL repeat-containing protein 2 [Pieris rapae]